MDEMGRLHNPSEDWKIVEVSIVVETGRREQLSDVRFVCVDAQLREHPLDA